MRVVVFRGKLALLLTSRLLSNVGYSGLVWSGGVAPWVLLCGCCSAGVAPWVCFSGY
jgi:hypothetical protein